MSKDKQAGLPAGSDGARRSRSSQADLQLAGSRLPDDAHSPYARGSLLEGGSDAGVGRNARLERKLRASKWALLLERAMPLVWLLLGVIGLFVLLSMAGLWLLVGPLTHKILLAVFALALATTGVLLVRLRWPSRDEAIARIERVSGVKHRPASSYEDKLTGGSDSPLAQALWQAHRRRLAKMIGALRVGLPAPRTDRHDPLALRALLLLAVIIVTIAAGDSAADRLRSAFQFGPGILSAEARLDVWVTPPPYTAKPPIMLSDGSGPVGSAIVVPSSLHELPENSVLIVRLSGTDPSGLTLEVHSDGVTRIERIKVKSLELVKRELAKKKRIKKELAENKLAKKQSARNGHSKDGGDNKDGAKSPQASVISDAGTSASGDQSFNNTYSGDVGELRYVIKSSGSVRVLSGSRELASYKFKVTPDQPPSIALLQLPGRSIRGALKLQYRIKDDYGVESARVQFEPLPEPAANPARAWARKPAKSGPRPKLPELPSINLSMPRSSARDGKAKSTHDLAKHPWAGRRVRMTLVVKDHAGQVGTSETVDLALPERHFRSPIARAIIEQRRNLMWDRRNRPDVIYALQAISAEPRSFIKSKGAYLGLRSAYYRLRHSASIATMDSVAEQLWNVAVRIEDGNLTAAERRLRDAQDKLAKALENGASQKEIAKLMQKLRQAMADYLKQLAARAPKGQQNPNGTGPNQFITSQDFEQMLRDMENMARSGNRSAAKQMLSEMRDLLDRLRSGRQARSGQSRQQQQMMKMMDEFGNLIGKQQKLLDDTFRQQQQGSRQQQGNRQQGRQGQAQQGQRGRREGNRRAGKNNGGGAQLGSRQGQLRQMLDRLTEQMKQFGLNPPDQLGKAGNAMGKSKQALGQGKLGEGLRHEGRALEQLRRGAQSMAEQMLSRMARRYGMRQGQRRQSLDPLGRPRDRANNDQGGTELNSRVLIPDQFRAQRSRRILEELRRRLGESRRPTLELDYLERLLKQF